MNPSTNTAAPCPACGAPAQMMRDEEDESAIFARCTGSKCDPEWQPLDVWNGDRLAVVPQTEQPSTRQLFKQSAARLALIAKEGNPIWAKLRAEVEDQAPAAMELVVTSADEVEKMQEAHERRRKLRDIRLLAEKEHKTLKRDIIDRGNAIDAAKREIVDVVAPLEQHLMEQEKFAENAERARLEALQQEREGIMRGFIDNPETHQFAQMSEADFLAFRDFNESRFYAAQDAARKAQQEAEAAAQKDREDRAAERAENERLRKEAAEKERALEAERAATHRAQVEAQEAARIEREAIFAKAQKEKADVEAKAKKERARIDAEHAAAQAEAKRKSDAAQKLVEAQLAAERKAASEAAAMERERQRKELAAAEAEREKVAAAARKEQARLQAIADAAELEAKTIREAKERADSEAAEQAAAEQAARDAAAKAPDKEKLMALAERISDMQELPTMATSAGAAVALELAQQLAELADWLRAQAEAL